MEILNNTQTLAIVIALENYESGEFGSIKYALNDGQAFCRMLQEKLQLPEEQILFWKNEEVTKEKLEEELPQLIQGLERGGRFIFYYVGHGTEEQGVTKLTAWDAQSLLSLQEILLKPLAGSGCQESLLFFDFSRGAKGLQAPNPQNNAEFSSLLDANSKHALFFSTSRGGQAYNSEAWQQSIWSQYVAQALSGESQEALGEGKAITFQSLSDYLMDFVPLYLRQKTSIKKTQRPVALFYGEGDHPIISFSGESSINEDSGNLGFQLKADEIYLRSFTYQSIARLPSYKKGNKRKLSNQITSSTLAFVHGLYEEDVKLEIKEIYQQAKQVLSLRRRDIEKDVFLGGGSLDTDIFRYDLEIEQNPEDPTEAMLTRRLYLRSSDSKLPENFDDIFPIQLDEVVVPLDGMLDFDDIVERFEDLEEEHGGHLIEDEDEGTIQYRTSAGLTVLISVGEQELILRPQSRSGCLELLEQAKIGLGQVISPSS
ncbi:MAG: hypothetical protein COB67_13445 [SAR324 cluster bacterium]|uniref:Peptidase C14 caspase domain-containing protein n=1 Tax=SAR324 cluster bacterium TaxID=2024889 RepID=A0A2A4SNT8_9DELT|nr:MAG: hypothetical protein COB67_13445 [SAR324 cluster bacterium]